VINFDKYKIHGDYHWQWYKGKHSTYLPHVMFVKDWVKEKPCLDVGCGDGLITSLIGATGIDDSSIAVGWAMVHEVKAFVMSAYQISGLGMYQSVLMGDVIEHLEDPGSALDQIWNILFPGGFLYVSTPPKQPSLSPYHYREYTPWELKELVELHGFDLVGDIIVRNDLVEMYGKFKKV